MTGQALIVQGDALHLPLPDASVDLIVTSPPYWALRAYQAGPGEIGSEPTPQAFLEALWAATAEMMRVLKPSGSMFIDLGDKYNSAASGQNGTGATGLYDGKAPSGVRRPAGRHDRMAERGTAFRGYPAKSLMLLPERYRIGCVDRLGLIARAVIVWNKPNGLPESVTDRVRRSHEDWVHLVKQPRYYSATDEVREPHVALDGRSPVHVQRNTAPSDDRSSAPGMMGQNPLGKLPGSVWSVPSEPLRLPEHLGVQHYAAFPSEWPRRLILGFSPPGICVDCNQGRVPVVEREIPDYRDLPMNPGDQGRYDATPINGGLTSSGLARPGWRNLPRRSATILGYACSCTPYTDHPGSGGTSQQGVPRQDGHDRQATKIREVSPNNRPGLIELHDYQRVGPWREYHLDGWKPPPTRPAVILDPFGGTGTTAMVARALGRVGVSVDLSAAYGRAARWRVRHDGAKAISRTNLERQGMLL